MQAERKNAVILPLLSQFPTDKPFHFVGHNLQPITTCCCTNDPSGVMVLIKTNWQWTARANLAELPEKNTKPAAYSQRLASGERS
jgi:hypothetical protein